jgi:hypothetical protein
MAQAIQNEIAFDLGFINRLVTRLEPHLDDYPEKPQPVAVFGHYPKFPTKNYVSWPLQANRSQSLGAEAFADYLRADILNIVLGRRVLRPPAPAELEQARRASLKVQPCSASGSVFREAESVAIVLEPDGPGRSLTLPQDN